MLLEKELSTEREINVRRGNQMNAKFVLEADQSRELETVRLSGQKSLQEFREERLKNREKASRDHESSLTRLRYQLADLESKLSHRFDAGDSSAGGGHEKGKKEKCVVM